MSDHTPQDAGAGASEEELRGYLTFLSRKGSDLYYNPAIRELIEGAFDELLALRAERARHAAVVAAARVYLAPDTGPIPERMAESHYGKLLQAMRDFDEEGGDA